MLVRQTFEDAHAFISTDNSSLKLGGELDKSDMLEGDQPNVSLPAGS